MQLNSLQIEQLSTILEIASFFLVTIDLYGKERIAQLGNRINHLIVWLINKLKPPNLVKLLGKISSGFLDILINAYWVATLLVFLGFMLVIFAGLVLTSGITFWRRLLALIIAIAIFLLMRVIYRYARTKLSRDELNESIEILAFMAPVTVTFSFTVFLIAALTIAIYLALCVVVAGIVFVLSLITIIILPLARLLLDKMKLEGILVWVGAILFVISKLIVIK